MKKQLPLYLTLVFTFLLGVHDGYVALWTESSEEPACVFPYSVYSLPDADRRALERGIRAESEQELHRLIEDFLS